MARRILNWGIKKNEEKGSYEGGARKGLKKKQNGGLEKREGIKKVPFTPTEEKGESVISSSKEVSRA